MNGGENPCIWQSPDGPHWRHQLPALTRALTGVSRVQGLLMGRLAALTEDGVKASEIEGEVLSVASVRSSIARRLGVDIGAVAPVDRHVEVLNRRLDGFEGKLTRSKWAAIAKCSPDTALRDITQLMTLGVLQKAQGGGRSAAYELAG